MPERFKKWRALRVKKAYERNGGWGFERRDREKELKEEVKETIPEFREIYGKKRVKRLIDG